MIFLGPDPIDPGFERYDLDDADTVVASDRDEERSFRASVDPKDVVHVGGTRMHRDDVPAGWEL